ncbi:MAG: hypothetical protein KME13_26800 [Myxacorys californica WJT36-NPBG1]|jgi:hypothetical protein|nr:hypothetical protein [Myxacorys californica WJT36-NPBG1]
MNYEPNTTHWKLGDLVIHDCDQKHPLMLMLVMDYTYEGKVQTRYVSPVTPGGYSRDCRRVVVSDLEMLHDPKRFGIEAEVAS